MKLSYSSGRTKIIPICLENFLAISTKEITTSSIPSKKLCAYVYQKHILDSFLEALSSIIA